MRLFSKLLMTGVLILGMFGMASAAPEIIIKAAHNSPPNEDQTIPWDAFKEFVERESNGRISVVVYGGASMGGCLETSEKVQMNILQMNFGSSSNLTAIYPELEVFELPYLVENTLDNIKLFYNKDASKFEGPVYEKLNKAFLDKGMKLVWISPASFRSLGLNKAKVYTPADLKGCKVRATASRIDRGVLQAFGASPVTMSFSEVYTALQLKTVEGVGLNAASMYTNKFHENLKTILKNRYNTFFMIASINKDFYNKLPDWAKDIVNRGCTYAIQTANAKWDSTNQAHENSMLKAGVDIHVPTDAEWKEWKGLAQSVYDQYAKGLDPEWIKVVKTRLAQ